MNKNTNNTGNLHPSKLLFPVVALPQKAVDQFNEIYAQGEFGPKPIAEAIAQAYSLKDTEQLMEWFQVNRAAFVYCPGHGELAMLEAVAVCAQGVQRIEFALQHVYHTTMIKNLLSLHEEQEKKSA